MDLDSLQTIKQRLNLSTMSKPALIGIVVILVLVAAIAGTRYFEAATASEFQINASASQERDAGESEQQAEPSTLFVHVLGEVTSPGLCELPEGSRVADAIERAGGFTEEADPVSVNLARLVSDGEQIIVTNKAQRAHAPEAAISGSGSEASPTTAISNGLININAASTADLMSLSGIGETLAERIVADRQSNGPFASADDIKRVPGIGDKKYEAIADAICV